MPPLGLSPVEEAFFRAGDALAESSNPELEARPPHKTFWRAVVAWLRIRDRPLVIHRTDDWD